MKKIRVNMVSESDIGVKGHGVHTAYIEIAAALEKRNDITLVRGEFGKQVECDIVHVHTIGFHCLKKLRQKNTAKVISAHVVPDSLVGSIVLAKYWKPVMREYMKYVYNKADKVLAVSSTVATILEKELHVPAEKIEVFYNVIDMAQYDFSKEDTQRARKKLGLLPGQKMVLGNGQVQPRKRLDTFVSMAKSLPETRFVWVGGIPFKQLGADYANMKKMMADLPENMKITGVIDHEEVRNYLAAADIFCLPAEQENHPMCVLEAAGAHLPIVLRDIPEYHDTFKDDGVLCSADEAFVAAVRRLSEDRDFYEEYVEKSKKIAQRFDSTQGAERLRTLYKELV